MAERGKLLGLFLQLTAVLSVVPGKQGLDLRCLRMCNIKEDISCLAKCAAERSRRDAVDYPQSGPCQPWPFTGHNLPYVPASPTDLRVVERNSSTCNVNGVNMQCESVTVEWKAAVQGIRDLRGFQASILKPGFDDCYQVIFPESVEADGETIYNHTFFPIFPGSDYMVSVYSLPMNYDSSEEAPPARITVTPWTCTEVNRDNPSVCGPGTWIPQNINIAVTGRSVNASFPVAPDEYNIDEYYIFINNMKCEESEFNCETWRDTCFDGVATDIPVRPFPPVPKPTDSPVVQVHYDELPPRKYLYEVRGDFRQTTCPTVFEVTDWAPDSLTITENMWDCTANVSFPAGDGVPSYRVCMDDDCALVTHDSGPNVSHTFQTAQLYHEYQVKVSDGRYADATNTNKSFTSLKEWAPNITDFQAIRGNDDDFLKFVLALTFMSPQCMQQYIINVCITPANDDPVCLNPERINTKPADKGAPWVTLDFPIHEIIRGSWEFRVKAANMPDAPEGIFTIDLPQETTTRPPPPTTMPKSSPPASSPTSPPNDSWKYGAAVGGVAAAIVLVIILVCCWKNPRRVQLPKICGDADNNLQPTGGNYHPSVNTITESLPDIQQKTVLLLASYDCVEHRTVVLCFAAYLQRECHCQVILDLHKTEDISKLGPMEWLVSHIHGVDYVIVICSAGTKLKATKDKKACCLQEIEPCGDLFTGGLKHINLLLHSRDEDMSKFINVYFPYSKKTDVPATLEIARTFKLMESMPALLCHIRGHSQFSMEGAVHIDVAEQVGSTESGRNLLSAIATMEAKDAAEPNWFVSRIVSTPEQDGGHSSISRANPNSNGKTNPTDKGEESSAKTPEDVNVMVDDEANVCLREDGYDEDDGYCPSIPMNMLNNGTIQYDHFLPQPDAHLYTEPEPFGYGDMTVQPSGPPYQPYQPEPVQFAPYGNQQDQGGWQSPYEAAMNNQQEPAMEKPHRPNLKLHIPEPNFNPPTGLHVPKEPSKEAVTPESGCYSGDIEDQLSLFNLQSQAAFSELQV